MMPRLPESLGPWNVSIWGMSPLRASPAKVEPGLMRGESTPEPRHGDMSFRGSRGWVSVPTLYGWLLMMVDATYGTKVE